jgi:hypothetical protein
MPLTFYDRLTGSKVKDVGKDLLYGRWMIENDAESDIFLNRNPVLPGTFLVPDKSGHWNVSDNESNLASGKVISNPETIELEVESIRAIGKIFQGYIVQEKNWAEWDSIIPLDPGLNELFNIFHEGTLEKRIQDLLGYLEAVCVKPKAFLKSELETVPVAKTRRIPWRSVSYLLSHTEDWESSFLGKITPKRILNETIHDQLDIYENRVAARLIDNLQCYLSRRTRQVYKLVRILQDKQDYSKSIGGTYFRINRLLELWGKSLNNSQGIEVATDILNKLDMLRFRIMRLKNTPLYSNVSRNYYISSTLKSTNILKNDQDYSRVVLLWEEWVKENRTTEKQPSEIYSDRQELCQGINSFAMLLIIRSLNEIGFSLRDESWQVPVRIPGQWFCEKNGVSLSCFWREDGTIELKLDNKSMVYLPLPVDLRASCYQKTVTEMINLNLEEANADRKVIVLYSGVSDDLSLKSGLNHVLNSIGNDPTIEGNSSIGFLPISPWDIVSTERVTRSLRWFFDNYLFNSYPPHIKTERNVLDRLNLSDCREWLSVTANTSELLVVRPVLDYYWNELGIGQLHEKTRTLRDQLHADHTYISERLQHSNSGEKKGSLKKQKTVAYQKYMESEKDYELIHKLYCQLEEAREKIQSLLVCPCCGMSIDPSSFKEREKGCFRCDCPSCNTRWGTRFCKNGHRFSVILPGGKFREPKDTNPGWIDRTYGGDLLALPARKDNKKWGFLCPVCGDIC